MAEADAPDQADSDLMNMTPEDFLRLLADVDDDDLLVQGLHDVGVQRALDAIHEGIAEHARPDAIDGLDTSVQWVIDDGQTQHHYAWVFANRECTAVRGTVDEPRATVKASLRHFLRIVDGSADPVRLLLRRRLSVKGDLLFARGLLGYFERPQV